MLTKYLCMLELRGVLFQQGIGFRLDHLMLEERKE